MINFELHFSNFFIRYAIFWSRNTIVYIIIVYTIIYIIRNLVKDLFLESDRFTLS